MNNNLATIIRNVDESLIPKEVKDAQKFEAAAKKLSDDIATATPVDLNTATKPGDIEKVIDDAVNFERDRDKRAQLAAEVAQIAHTRLEAAWSQTAHDLVPHFAEQFDAAAARLYAELKNLDGADPHQLHAEHWNQQGDALREATATLTRLRTVRDAFALWGGTHRSPVVSTRYESSSRTAMFVDQNHEQAFSFVARNNADKNYWILLALDDRAQIKWQTRQQQDAQPYPAQIIKSQTEMAESFEKYGTARVFA